MRVLVAGSSGYIGSALVSHLRASGTEVHRVLRSPAGEGDAYYDASRHTVDLSRVPGGSLEGFDAVYAIGGVPLTPRRWGQRKRDAIHASRVEVVDALARAVARTDGAPPALIAMSAIGIYGERGDEELTETSSAGRGFVADLCRAWEYAASPARACGARVVSARFGIVLGPGGGFLGQLAPLFSAGLGAQLGNGRQWMSWIALDDAARVLEMMGSASEFSGVVNVVAPEPVTNAHFTKRYAALLGRHARLVVPKVALTAAAGRRVTEEFLLQSARVRPERLLEAGFPYRYPDLDGALRAAIEA